MPHSGFRNRHKHDCVDLLRRSEANPLLTARDWPYPANSVFNPGAVLLPDGDTLLLARVEDRRGFSHLTAARSRDGLSHWRIDPRPTIVPDPENYPEELWGIEDPRLVWMAELENFAVTYTAFSAGGPLISLALTRDFLEFERRGPIMPPADKDGALFPRRFGGRWALLHRPMPASADEAANIWISFSPDLKHWGDHQVVMHARRGGWWDAGRIGLSVPPLETSEGWLIVYHGVRHTPAGCLYRLGLALLDLEEPTRVLRRGEEWVFGPEADYEQMGDIPGVVFPCGCTVAPDSETIRLYYGAADSAIAMAEGRISELLGWLGERST